MAGEDVLYPELERELAEIAARVAVDPSTVLGDFELSEADRAELARPERMQIIRESISEQAAAGVAGWVDDDLASATASPTYSSLQPTASGWLRTFPPASSRSTTQQATWDPTPSRR
jgi:hypothetical protein